MTPSSSPTTNEIATSGHGIQTTSRKSGRTGSRATWEKADRLLLEGRLRVVRVDGSLIVAECRGDSGVVYELTHAGARWTCSCPARTDCSHLRALWRVVAVES